MALSSTMLPMLLLIIPFTQHLLSTASLPCDVVVPPDCSHLPPGSFHPHEESCQFFYRCDELGNSRAFACPDDHRYSGILGKICLPASQVRCERCAPEPKQVREEQNCWPLCPPNPTCEPSERGKLKPYPPNCHKYIYCDGSGNEVISTCPNVTLFDPPTEKCVSPSLSHCQLCHPGY